ncbi:MAG: hypothetical protein IPM42_01815 [Saprospiraceae bacterium]|nr:hypothetical protein [Saprospiraceae bacterium]
MNLFAKNLFAPFFSTITIVAVLTFFAIGKNYTSANSGSNDITHIHETATCIANTVGNYIPTERSNSSIQNSTPSLVKKTSDHLSAYIRCNDKLRISFLFQYLQYSDCLLVHFRKTDIIFPFHYFW